MKTYHDDLVSRYQERLAELYDELKESRDPELPFFLAQVERDFVCTFGFGNGGEAGDEWVH